MVFTCHHSGRSQYAYKGAIFKPRCRCDGHPKTIPNAIQERPVPRTAGGSGRAAQVSGRAGRPGRRRRQALPPGVPVYSPGEMRHPRPMPAPPPGARPRSPFSDRPAGAARARSARRRVMLRLDGAIGPTRAGGGPRRSGRVLCRILILSDSISALRKAFFPKPRRPHWRIVLRPIIDRPGTPIFRPRHRTPPAGRHALRNGPPRTVTGPPPRRQALGRAPAGPGAPGPSRGR